jgi:hypothetical protein
MEGPMKVGQKISVLWAEDGGWYPAVYLGRVGGKALCYWIGYPDWPLYRASDEAIRA